MPHSTTSIGNLAESWATEYLLTRGYRVVARNARTRHYEIDIVATKKLQLYFVEVKYRNNNLFGGGEAAISADKYTRMSHAAEDWITNNPKYAKFQPQLDVLVVTADKAHITHYSNISAEI